MPGDSKSEKIDPQGAQRDPRVSQKGAKGTKIVPKGDQNAFDFWRLKEGAIKMHAGIVKPRSKTVQKHDNKEWRHI